MTISQRVEVETEYYYESINPEEKSKWFYKIYLATFKGEGLEKIKIGELLLRESDEIYKSQSLAKEYGYRDADALESDLKNFTTLNID